MNPDEKPGVYHSRIVVGTQVRRNCYEGPNLQGI